MSAWRVHRALLSVSVTLLCACVDEETLSVYGLAERYKGSLQVTSGDCQRDEWSLEEPSEALTLSLKQTESAGLELNFEGAASPIYGQLCLREDERPRGLCLYGKQLISYQVIDPGLERPLSCQLWAELTGAVSAEECCEQVELGTLNTLKVTDAGGLEGTIERQLSLSLSEDSEAAEALCGGPLACHYQVRLSMEASDQR